MNDDQKQIAIQLAEDKIRQLQAYILSLRNETPLTAHAPSVRGRKPDKNLNKLGQEIFDALSHSDKPMTPAQLIQALEGKIRCNAAQIRVALRKYKGPYFDSPEYGKWQTVDQKQERSRQEQLIK